MTTTVDTVRHGVDRSRETVARINEIGQKIQEAVDRVGEIALSTDEQRTATTAMAQTTEEINNRVMAEDSAIQDARRELTVLASTAAQTRTLLAGFRL